MILTGKAIESEREKRLIEISPFNTAQVNPNSYDLRLGDKILVYKRPWYKRLLRFLGFKVPLLDTKEENEVEERVIPDTGIVIEPGELYLCHTEEVVYSSKYVSIVDGKSSLGRLGIFIHITAGYVDVGFRGQVTLELTSVVPVRIYKGMRIGQIRYMPCDGDITLYKGNYTGKASMGPVPSRSWNQFDRGSK